jgi:dynein heavy chain
VFFPVAVLQCSVKLTNEPPKGVRANLIKSFDGLINKDEWETCTKPRPWKKLLVGLAFFHALTQERRKFGPLGWNVRYGFDESDLDTSVNVLERFVQEQDEVPWDALNYVTGHINFGGRVTDDWDRRALLDILEIPASPGILTDGYKFSDSGTYYAPPVGSYAELMAYTQSLPELDEPGVFGMHENADTTYNKSVGGVLIHDMLSLEPRAAGGGAGLSPDEQVNALAVLLQESLPKQCDLDDAGETTFVVQPNGLLMSLMIVLQQEIVKFNRLLGTMSVSLIDLQKAIEGLIVMSSDLDKCYTCFMNNALPPVWERDSFASMKTLGSWNKDLIFRVGFMEHWLVHGQPAFFPLNLFFFPQGFMTGAMQTFARKYQVPVNKLAFGFEVLPADTVLEDMPEPDDGVVCNGIFLEAARWDPEACELVDSKLGEIYTEFPPVHFLPELDHHCDPTKYECPTYKTAVRKGALSTTGMSTNYVVAVELPCTKKPTAWVMAGTAFMLNLTD